MLLKAAEILAQSGTVTGEWTPTLADFLGARELKGSGCKLGLCPCPWPCWAVPGAQVARLFRGPALCLGPSADPLATRPPAGVVSLLRSPPFFDVREPSSGFFSGLHKYRQAISSCLSLAS